ncbi:MAG: hypothetical protein ACKVH8_16690 [Pirellulales bacterium]
MPAGLADQLQNRAEFLDLVKFISILGKPGKYANDESPVIRKWRVISASKRGKMPAEDAAWLPAYSKVSGELPVKDFPTGDSVFARGFVNVLVTGTAKLDINNIDGLNLWIDGMRVNDVAAPIKLNKGRHSLTFEFQPSQRESGLRVELKAMDKTVKFQPEGGL